MLTELIRARGFSYIHTAVFYYYRVVRAVFSVDGYLFVLIKRINADRLSVELYEHSARIGARHCRDGDSDGGEKKEKNEKQKVALFEKRNKLFDKNTAFRFFIFTVLFRCICVFR